LPDFLLSLLPKTGKNEPNEHKMYQMSLKTPDVRKIFQMTIKYINIFQGPPNFTQIGSFYLKKIIWQPCSLHSLSRPL
jgi:hypothetical protein